MKSCKKCGGPCSEIGGGKFMCDYCAAVFSESDFEPVSRQSAAAPAAASGTDVFDKNINGILEISWSDNRYTYSGSGLLITADGYAITNTHVVTSEDGRSCGMMQVKIAEQTVTASVVALGDDRHGSGNGVDLALIRLSRVPQGAKPLTIDDYNKVRNGEQVYVIGNSLGFGTCITSGIVSDRARVVGRNTYIMTDCATNGGNSGGPLFNSKGNVIGVHVSAHNNAVGMKYAIPESVMEQFVNNCRCGIRLKKNY